MTDQPSRLVRLGPSVTGTGAATDSEIREAKEELIPILWNVRFECRINRGRSVS